MKKLRYLIPVPIKKILKYSFYALEDAFNFIRGKSDPNYPPKRLNFVGSHDFKSVGKEFLNHFQSLGKLSPTDQVLDIGCGIGRMAIPLTSFLDKDAQYEGFDIDKRGVEWCQKNITSKHPHFRFQYTDIYNKYYNKKGRIQAQEFKFPYEDNSFDFVFATSVFTHMLTQDAENYLREISRVTRPNGTIFLTWFVLSQESLNAMKANKTTANFQYQLEKAYYSHKNNPEAETAYEATWLIKNLETNGLRNISHYPGWWSGAKDSKSYQDIIIAKKD